MFKFNGLIIIFVLFFLSCQGIESVQPIDITDIQGTWVLDSASRNGENTESLDGLFYTFDEKKIITNLLGDTAKSDFSIQDQQIIHILEDTMKYQIISLNDSTLRLLSNIQNTTFGFKFHKLIHDPLDADSIENQELIQ